MSMDNSNEQFETNSEPRKADIIRARDIIPGTPKRDKGRLGTPSPYGNITRQEPDSQPTGGNKPSPPVVPQTSPEKELGDENVHEAQSEQIKPVEDISAAPIKTEQQRSEIPEFDLAEKIMARQRRITAIRRKAPGQRDEAQSQQPKVESIGYTIGPSPALSEQEHIIAEIVAKDIEKFVQGQDFKRP